MNENQAQRLAELLDIWKKRGPHGLRPTEKDELINLLIKKLNS